MPPRLHVEAQRITFDLALRYSSTGDPRDSFTGIDRFPVLSIGGWLLDDLGSRRRSPSHDTLPDATQCRLFMVSFLGAISDEIWYDGGDRSRGWDEESAALARWCDARQTDEIRRLVTGSESFWLSYLQRQTLELESRIDPHAPNRGRWSWSASAAALVVLELCHANELCDSVLEMVEDLGIAFEIWDDLVTIQADLVDGRITFPIQVAATAAGIPLEPRPRGAEVLGALVVTNALSTVLDVASKRLEASAKKAMTLGLRTSAAFIRDVSVADADRKKRLTGARDAQGVVTQRRQNVHEPSVTQATRMAERFLLADQSFRESWETHREGMLGADEVASRFPAALILEILCRRGHDLHQAVDDFTAHAELNAFRYYDHQASDPDADTVGAVLRLLRYSSGKPHSAVLRGTLTCIDRLVESRGEVPVWLAPCVDEGAGGPPTLTLGERCGTVAAHLLIGLAQLDNFSFTVHNGATALFDRIADVGLGANINYPPLYALAKYFELLAHRPHDPAQAVLIGELERRSHAVTMSPQEAALAILATRAASRPELIADAWIRTILRRQRSDGSWLGEAFAMAPNRGWRTTAYSSTTLTTALCYDALAGTSETAPAEG